MAETIKIFSSNILEDGTVTVTGEDSAYPATRLHDRSRNLYWRYSATGALTFHVDQGATGNVGVDAMAIIGHNFDGEDMQWQYSDNDSDWYDAVTDWTQSGNADIVKTLGSPATHRYWRVTVSSMTNPLCGEIWMSEGYSFDIARKPDPFHSYRDNVRWSESIGGQVRSIKFGESGSEWSYSLRLSSLTDIDSIVSDLDGFSLPFFFKDKDSNYSMGRFFPLPAKDFFDNTYSQVDVHIIEML